MRCVIVDIDGTLANNLHRVHHLAPGKPKDWETYDSLMYLDQPIQPLVDLINFLAAHYSIVLCSGRKESCRAITIAWLKQHHILWNELFMRKNRDFRADAIIKSELLDQILARGYQPQFVIDDRNSVVAMWRERGLVCLQAAPGDF